MMSISFQLTSTPLPLDGATSKPQSTDSESAQPVSFGEVLKVEEKKLEHEINVLSTAIMFTTIQTPVMTESLFGFDPSADVESANSAGQTPPVAATPQPISSPLELNSTPLQTEAIATETKPVQNESQEQKPVVAEVKDTPEKVDTGDKKSDHPKMKLAEPIRADISPAPTDEIKPSPKIEAKDSPALTTKVETPEISHQPIKLNSGDESSAQKSDHQKIKLAEPIHAKAFPAPADEVKPSPKIETKDSPALTTKVETPEISRQSEKVNSGDESSIQKSDHQKIKLAEPTHAEVLSADTNEIKASSKAEIQDSPTSTTKVETPEVNLQPVKNHSGNVTPDEKADSPKVKLVTTNHAEISSRHETNEKEQPIRLTTKKEFETVISAPEAKKVVREQVKPASQNIPVIKTEVVAAKPVEPTAKVDEQTQIPPEKTIVKSNHFIVADFEAKLAASPQEFYVDSSSEADSEELATESSATTNFENVPVSETEAIKPIVVEHVTAHKVNPTKKHEQPQPSESIEKANVAVKAESVPAPVIKEAAQVEIKHAVLPQPSLDMSVSSAPEPKISKPQSLTEDVQPAEQIKVQTPKGNLSERLSKIFHPEKQDALPEMLQKVIVHEMEVELPSTEPVIAKPESSENVVSKVKVSIPVVKVDSTEQTNQPEKTNPFDSAILYEGKPSPKREVTQPVTAMTLETEEPISGNLALEDTSEKIAFDLDEPTNSYTKISAKPTSQPIEKVNIPVEKPISSQSLPTAESQPDPIGNAAQVVYAQDTDLEVEVPSQPISKVHIQSEITNSANADSLEPNKTEEPDKSESLIAQVNPSKTKMNRGFKTGSASETVSQAFSFTSNGTKTDGELETHPTSKTIDQTFSVESSETKIDVGVETQPTSKTVGQNFSLPPSETKTDNGVKTQPTSEAIGQAFTVMPSKKKIDIGAETRSTNETTSQEVVLTPFETKMDDSELVTRSTDKKLQVEGTKVAGQAFSQVITETSIDGKLTVHPAESKVQLDDEFVNRPTDEKPKVEGTKVSGQDFGLTPAEISMDGDLTIRSTESKVQMDDELVNRPTDEKLKVESTKISGQGFGLTPVEISVDGELTTHPTKSKTQTNDEFVNRPTDEKPKVEGTKVADQAFSQVTNEISIDAKLTAHAAESTAQMDDELVNHPTDKKPKVEGTKVAGQDLKLTPSETKMDGELATRATSETVTKIDVEVAKVKTDNAKAEIHSEVAGRSKIRDEARDLHPVKKKDEEKQVKDVKQAESNFVVGNAQQSVVVDAPEKLSVGQVKEYEVIQQIASQLKPRIKIGETSMRLTLKPDELGSIEVEMVSNAQGVSVSFVTEQASTGQLLESQVNQLKQSLKDAGVQLNNLNINQHNQPRHEGGAFRQEQRSSPFHAQDIQDGVPPKDNTQVERIISPHEVDYLI